jgi:hypothetical protein
MSILRWTGLWLTLAGLPAYAEPEALIGILQGPVALVRQSTRFTAVEGTALAEGDIVETGKGAFMQIEFADGALVGVGEATRLIVKPRLTSLKTATPPRLYQIDGWTKLRVPDGAAAGLVLWTPYFELEAKGASAVVQVQPRKWGVFVESGAVRVLQRDGAKAALGLGKGDFASQREDGDKPVVSAQLSEDFVKQMPRMFRDPLPARGALFAKRNVQPVQLGSVSYEDVSAWLHCEPAIRLALSKQWRGRASDKAFRTAAAANLSAHMEWERVLFPERFLPKKPAPPPARVALPASDAMN